MHKCIRLRRKFHAVRGGRYASGSLLPKFNQFALLGDSPEPELPEADPADHQWPAHDSPAPCASTIRATPPSMLRIVRSSVHLEDFGPHPHRRDHADPGDRLSRQRPDLHRRRDTRSDARFDSAAQATAAADASREFKGAVVDHSGRGAQLRRPSAARLSRTFDAGAQRAREVRTHPAVQRRAGSLRASMRSSGPCGRMHGNFLELKKEYERLGIDADGPASGRRCGPPPRRRARHQPRHVLAAGKRRRIS